MKRLLVCLGLLAIAACGGAGAREPTPSSAPPLDEAAVAALDAEANAAYAAQQYATCGRGFAKIAAAASRAPRQRSASYNAACCYALAGDGDASFAALDRAAALGLRDSSRLLADPDLAAVRADARWSPWLARFEAGVAAWERSLGDAALRRELLALVAEDQAARLALIDDGKGEGDPQRHERSLAAMQAIDRRTTARMKEVVAQRGWPSFALVGEDGASAAWLLVQHADLDPAFQKACLAEMQPLVERQQASAIDYAYLYDRVAVAEHRPQRYGTQFNDRREPQPIEDEAGVDARRAALGMPSMAAYRAMMLKMYGPPAAPLAPPVAPAPSTAPVAPAGPAASAPAQP